MPVQNCKVGEKPGYRWGSKGKCYTYSPNNEASRKKAKQKAYLQGAAMGMESISQVEVDNFIDDCKGERIVGIYEYRRK